MVRKLIRAYKTFAVQHPRFPLLNRLQDDITQMQSHELKKLPKDQQAIFCISLLWFTKNALLRQALYHSALGEHIERSLKTFTRRFSASQLLALEAEYVALTKDIDIPDANPTSTIR